MLTLLHRSRMYKCAWTAPTDSALRVSASRISGLCQKRTQKRACDRLRIDPALDQQRVRVQPLPYGRMKNARDAAAITAVAAQPQIVIDRDSVSRPMTLGLRTISIITAISGAASTPLTTAAQ